MIPFEEDDEIISLKCSNKHIFHINCLETAFKIGMNKCPMCREPIKLDGDYEKHLAEMEAEEAME